MAKPKVLTADTPLDIYVRRTFTFASYTLSLSEIGDPIAGR
jgi:hypothetical protein